MNLKALTTGDSERLRSDIFKEVTTMQSYKARMKEAQKAVILVMAADTIAEFGPTLAPYGFSATSHSFDKEWETLEVTFKDPVRRDEICITVDCDSHKFGAIYLWANKTKTT